MIVVITSWAPVVAFKKPAIPAQIAPAAAAPATASRIWAGLVMYEGEVVGEHEPGVTEEEIGLEMLGARRKETVA